MRGWSGLGVDEAREMGERGEERRGEEAQHSLVVLCMAGGGLAVEVAMRWTCSQK